MPAPTPDTPRLALVVDDDRVDRLAHRRALQRSGRFDTVAIFSSGAEALAHLDRPDRPDVALLLVDMHLPGLCGFDLVAAARQRFRPQERPVTAMLSSLPAPAEVARAEADPALARCLVKPVSPGDINDLMKTADATPAPEPTTAPRPPPGPLPSGPASPSGLPGSAGSRHAV